MDYEDLLQFQSQNMPVQVILRHRIIHVRIQKLSSHELDSQNLQQIKQIQGKKIKQIDFTCDYELQEQELKLIEQIIRLIKAQNEILYFVIQNCEWNKELQQFIQNISDLKVSFEIKFQNDEWFQQISDLNIYKQSPGITFLSNSLTIQINEVGIFFNLNKRSFINSLQTQQKLKEIASYLPQKVLKITFQQNLEDQEILNLIDSIAYFQLQRVVFYKVLTLERQNQTYDSGYHLVLEEDISSQLVQKLFKQFNIISMHSNVKKAVDYSTLLQQESLHSFKSHVNNKYNILSLEKIKDYFEITNTNPKLKEIFFFNCLDYQKFNHLKIQSQFVELNTLQELTKRLTQFISDISIEILITCVNQERFSNDKAVSSVDQQLLNNLTILSKQFQKGFQLKINDNFMLKTLPSQTEIYNKIEKLDLCQLNLSQMKKIKIDTSESNLQKVSEFFQKLLEENFELFSIEILIPKEEESNFHHFFDSQKKKDPSLKLFQLLKYIQVQNLQQIQHLNIQNVQKGYQAYFNLEQSELVIIIDKCIENYEFTILFLQNLVPLRTNQFSSVKYSGQSQDHKLHTVIIDKLKELSHNKLINIDIQNCLNIDVQNKTIKFHKLKDYSLLMNYLNQNLISVQIAEKLAIEKSCLRPKKNTLQNLINFFLQNGSKIKSVDLASLQYKFDISQVLSILQYLFQAIPKFTISNFQHKFLQFDSDEKIIVTHLYNNNEYFKQAFSHFNKIYLKMNNITDKANEEVLALINQNNNLKEFILNVQKFDQIDFVSKIQFRSFQFENFLIQGNSFKIFFEKKSKILKIEANSMQVIQHFLMNNTAQNQDLFTSIEKIELLDLSQSYYNEIAKYCSTYQSFNYFLIKPFQIMSLKLQAWQSLNCFLELIEFVGKLKLESMFLDLNIEVENKHFCQENEQITKTLQDCLFHSNIKEYKFNFRIFQKNSIAWEMSYNQNRLLNLVLYYFQQFQVKTQFSQQQIVDLLYQFVKGFNCTRKVLIFYFHTKDRSIINLFLTKMSNDLPFLSRIFVKSEDFSYYAHVNQHLKLKSYFLNLIQLLKNKKMNYGLNRAEKFIDLLEYFQTLNNNSIKSHDLVWDYERILKTL